MARLILLAPFAALLGGCIIYDHGKCPGCEDEDWWTDDSGRPPEDDPDYGDDSGDTDEVSTAFVLDPSVGEAGTTFIASLSAPGGFDFARVADVELYGDAAILATDVRPDEVLLSIQIPGSAPAGTADLLVVLDDGTAEFVAGALTIVAGDGSSDGSDDGTDTDDSDGSGCP